MTEVVALTGASLVAQRVKRLPTMRETWVLFLGRENPLEKEMANPPWLALGIPWTEGPGRLQSMGCKESDVTEQVALTQGTHLTGSNQQRRAKE